MSVFVSKKCLFSFFNFRTSNNKLDLCLVSWMLKKTFTSGQTPSFILWIIDSHVDTFFLLWILSTTPPFGRWWHAVMSSAGSTALNLSFTSEMIWQVLLLQLCRSLAEKELTLVLVGQTSHNKITLHTSLGYLIHLVLLGSESILQHLHFILQSTQVVGEILDCRNQVFYDSIDVLRWTGVKTYKYIF